MVSIRHSAFKLQVGGNNSVEVYLESTGLVEELFEKF